MPSVRASVLAGEWYPDDPNDLKRIIRGYLDRVPERKISGRLIGLISPHAGYVYSGFTAAHGYKQLIGKSFDVVAVLSPFHSYPSGSCMIPSASAYETPLGRVPVARDLVDRLKAEVEITEPRAEREHSVEIQVPFLQMTLKNFSLLPIMLWNPDVWDVENLVGALHKVLKGKNALLVASTDLHHLNSLSEVKARDAKVAEALESYDLRRIRTALEPDSCTVCGKVPVSVVVDVAKRLGADNLEILYRSNSRDEYKGEYEGSYTVGYLSAVMTGG
jgi:AmmeMemoRadiSam system protein B